MVMKRNDSIIACVGNVSRIIECASHRPAENCWTNTIVPSLVFLSAALIGWALSPPLLSLPPSPHPLFLWLAFIGKTALQTMPYRVPTLAKGRGTFCLTMWRAQGQRRHCITASQL